MAPVLLHVWLRPAAYMQRDTIDSGSEGGGDKDSRGVSKVQPHVSSREARCQLSVYAIAAALSHVFLSAFLLGWHVHEKAVLHCLLPLSLLASASPAWAAEFLILATVSHYSLLPLLFTLPEYPIKLLLLSLFSLALLLSSLRLFSPSPHHRRTLSTHQPTPNPQFPKVQYPSWLYKLRVVHALGVLPLEMLCQLLYHHPGLHARFPFLPLLLTSVYCAVGITVAWAVQLYAIVSS
ncbi:hypothetical protein CLOP_g18641 [Closterium sp. NIES-67]|nr:hypothetical protein CLOP_g18641 [Closterium sp. NIES-67]